MFKKIESENKTKYEMKFSLKVGNIIHESDIDDVFQSRLYYNYNKDKKNI